MTYLLAPLVAWTVAQTAKVIIYSVRARRLTPAGARCDRRDAEQPQRDRHGLDHRDR